MDLSYSTRGPDPKAKEISIIFVLAKLIKFCDDPPAVGYVGDIKKMFEYSKHYVVFQQGMEPTVGVHVLHCSKIM
jgi:hypothetical protein